MKNTDDIFERLGEILNPLKNKMVVNFPENFAKIEAKKILYKMINEEPFECDEYTGGDATISVINNHFDVMGFEATMSGQIKFTIENYDSNPCDNRISEDGYFDGYIYLWDSKNEKCIYNDVFLIEL